MRPWSRLRQLAERVVGGDERRPPADDAIYLTETAYRNSRPGPAATPAIRERHFGFGLRRQKAGEERAAGSGRPGGLLTRLGLRRPTAAPGDPAYAGTKIVGTPHPPSKPEVPVYAAPKEKPAAKPETVKVAAPERPTVKPAPAPVAAALPDVKPAPAAAPKAPAPSKTPAVAAPVIRPAPEKPVDDEAMLRRLFGEPEPVKPPKPKAAGPSKPAAAKPAPAKPVPVAAVTQKKKKMDRGDITVATLGVLLAVTCAVFPWYIFFNQEKFGVREFVFSGDRGSAWPSPGLAFAPQPVGKPFANADVPKMELDFFPTATLPVDGEPARAVPASEQPFPSDRVNFRLVHVANGRAMIEDGDGLWVVQRGSRLPDSSRVVAIEQHEGRWVIVTSHDGIVELQAN